MLIRQMKIILCKTTGETNGVNSNIARNIFPPSPLWLFEFYKTKETRLVELATEKQFIIVYETMTIFQCDTI